MDPLVSRSSSWGTVQRRTAQQVLVNQGLRGKGREKAHFPNLARSPMWPMSEFFYPHFSKSAHSSGFVSS